MKLLIAFASAGWEYSQQCTQLIFHFSVECFNALNYDLLMTTHETYSFIRYWLLKCHCFFSPLARCLLLTLSSGSIIIVQPYVEHIRFWYASHRKCANRAQMAQLIWPDERHWIYFYRIARKVNIFRRFQSVGGWAKSVEGGAPSVERHATAIVDDTTLKQITKSTCKSFVPDTMQSPKDEWT